MFYYLVFHFTEFIIVVSTVLILYMCYCIFSKRQPKALLTLIITLLISIYGIYNFRYDRGAYVITLVVSVFLYIFLSLLCQRHKSVMTVILLFVFTLPAWAPVFLMGPFTILLIGSFFAWISISRDTVQIDVVTSISSCLKQNMPLSTALARSAEGLGDGAAKVLLKLSQYLSEGYSLSDSIKLGYRKCPGYVAGLLKAAEDVNRLPQAAEYISAKYSPENCHNASSGNSIYNIILYPLSLMLIVSIFIAFFGIFIIPPISQMLSDMSVEVPEVTIKFIQVSKTLVHNGGFLILIPLTLFIVFRCMFFVRRVGKLSIISMIGDVIKWYLPVVSWFVKTESNIRVLAYMRMALAAGVPFDRIVSNCGDLDLNVVFKRRINKWHRLIVSGTPVAQAAGLAHMDQSIVWCLNNNTWEKSAPNALEMLEKSYSSVLDFKMNVAREIIGPASVLFCALVVGLICYAIFKPLVLMIYAVM